MGKILDEDLIYEILSVVEEIPEGKVASYGQIARLIGRDKNSRLVGKVLGMAEFYGKYPCHRVVNHAGRTAPGWREQKMLLEDEGVEFKANGCVDMNQNQRQDYRFMNCRNMMQIPELTEVLKLKAGENGLE